MLKDVVTAHRPENYFLKRNTVYPTDQIGDPYLPLTAEVSTPLLFDPERPGKGIMIHFMNRPKRDRFTATASQIKQQGFLSPRQYATFSTVPEEWIIDPSVSVLVFRSFSRWSREYGHKDYTQWVEGLIGVTEEQASALSPEAVRYHRRMRGNRYYLGWDIWSYIPPQHLLGILDFRRKRSTEAFEEQNLQLKRKYEVGLITEAYVAEFMRETRQHQSVHGLDGSLSQAEKDEFWTSYAGAITENALMYHIAIEDRDAVAGMRPSYPWTQNVQAQALNA